MQTLYIVNMVLALVNIILAAYDKNLSATFGWIVALIWIFGAYINKFYQ